MFRMPKKRQVVATADPEPASHALVPRIFGGRPTFEIGVDVMHFLLEGDGWCTSICVERPRAKAQIVQLIKHLLRVLIERPHVVRVAVLWAACVSPMAGLGCGRPTPRFRPIRQDMEV